MERKIPKSFKYWLRQDLEQYFDIKNVKGDLPLLNEWILSQNKISVFEKEQLEIIKQELQQNATYWNEEELKMRFISPLLRLVNIDGEKFRMFFDRQVTAEYKNIKLTGVADMLVATGYQVPTKPFFFIHEFKPEARLDTDPAGQLLAEMIAAQVINDDKKPIFGCYLIGRNWFFVVLEGNEYKISDAFVATQDDIFQIFQILRKVKEYITERVQNA